jgi:Zn-dependent protease
MVALISLWLLDLRPVPSSLIGLGISVVHWLSLFVHHFGHAIAARRTGYPMVGMRIWWWLATSLYPGDEPSLPREIHLQRAFGGPVASLAFAVMAALLVLPLYAAGYWAWPFFAIAGLDSFLIFAIGSLIPLGFNDGSTILRWLRERKE